MHDAEPLVTVVPGEGLRLHIANRRDALEPARLALTRFLDTHAPGEALRYRAELVLEETLMNVIWHAFDDAALHRVALHVQVEADQLRMAFEDEGKPFDPLEAQDPALPRRLEDAAPGGLGLMLVRRLARSVDYARHAGRNHLTVCLARG